MVSSATGCSATGFISQAQGGVSHGWGLLLEQPVLRLGLLGFGDAAAARLGAWAAATQPGWPAWQACDPHMADAWMISGPAVDVLDRDVLTIRHPLDSGERLSLNRAEVDRPLAFATPLPDGFASAEFFDAGDEQSVRQRLQRFEAWLRPLRSQFALGAQLTDRLPRHKGEVVHVVHEGRLLAVLDLARWQAGLLTAVRPVDLAMADWVRRPSRANDIPTSFIRLPLNRVLWTYAVRSARDLLPARYRQQVIHLRRVPSLPARWFDELHLLLMRELMARPGTFADLCLRSGADAVALAHHLAALYFAGAVTTDPDSARRAEPAARRALLSLQFDQAGGEADPTQRPASSGLGAPSSILREPNHSPLRPATDAQTVRQPLNEV